MVDFVVIETARGARVEEWNGITLRWPREQQRRVLGHVAGDAGRMVELLSDVQHNFVLHETWTCKSHANRMHVSSV